MTPNPTHPVAAAEVTTDVLHGWFANPDAWRALAWHAAGVREHLHPGTADWRLLGRTIGVAEELAAALDRAAADATLTHAPDDPPEPPPMPRGRGRHRGSAREKLPDVAELITAGVDPQTACARAGTTLAAAARAARRAGGGPISQVLERADGVQRRRQHRSQAPAVA